MDPFTGEIRLLPYTYAPEGWALCNGQLLAIQQYTPLFSVIGTMYGGDGRVNFAVPNLMGRVVVHQGQGPGLSLHNVGQTFGVEQVTLTSLNMPSHDHQMFANKQPGTTNDPSMSVPASGTGIYAAATGPQTPMNQSLLGYAGGAQGGVHAHQNMAPFVAMQYCICLDGIYPVKSQ